MNMKRWIALLCALLILVLPGCGKKQTEEPLKNITAAEAKELMDSEKDYVILDVREQEEYDEIHIPGATLLPLGEVAARAEQVLPDKDQLILVYCRSGRRSKEAANTLLELGYTRIREFGGIIDWPYETE